MPSEGSEAGGRGMEGSWAGVTASDAAEGGLQPRERVTLMEALQQERRRKEERDGPLWSLCPRGQRPGTQPCGSS